MSSPTSTATTPNRTPRRKKVDNADLTPPVLLTQLNRLLGLSHGRRAIHQSLSIDPNELLSRPIVAGAKATFCLLCAKEKTKLEAHVLTKELKKILSSPPSDLSTIDYTNIEVRGFLHLSLLHSCPAVPTRPTSIDLSFVCDPQSSHEYLNVRGIIDAMSREGIVLHGVPQSYIDPFVGRIARAPSPLRMGSPPPLLALPAPPSLPLVPTSTTEFAGAIDVQAFLSSHPPPRELPPLFQGPGNLCLLFDTSLDANHVEMANRGSRGEWSDRARREMGWNHRLILKQHPLLMEYCAFVDTEAAAGQWTRKSRQHLQFLLRVLAMVQRTRGRLGEEVTVLDVACSTSALHKILKTMEEIDVGFPTILNTIKGLISLFKYISTLVVHHQGVFSTLGLRDLIRDTRTILNDAMTRTKSREEGGRTGEQRDAKAAQVEPYPVLEMVIASPVISDAVESIASRLDLLTKPRYDFALNSLISYLLTFNAARNEIIWKSLNRTFYILQKEERKLLFPFSRFRSLSAARIDSPKSSSVRSTDASKSGWFLLDDQGRRLLKSYEAVRERRMEELEISGYDHPNAPFFYSYEGKAIDETQATSLTNRMHRLAKDLGLRIRMNSDAVRHAAAQVAFDEYVLSDDADAQSTALLSLMQHSPHVHTKYYIDKKVALAIVGFRHLRSITERCMREDEEIAGRVEELREKMTIRPLLADYSEDDSEEERRETGDVNISSEEEDEDEEEEEGDDEEEEEDDSNGDDGEGEEREDNTEQLSEEEEANLSMGEDGGDWEIMESDRDEGGAGGLSGEEHPVDECPPVKRRRSTRGQSINFNNDRTLAMDETLDGNDASLLIDQSAVEGAAENCRFAGVDGNPAHSCSDGCPCISLHSSSFIMEHDVKRISKEIGRNRLHEEERARLEQGFTLSGLTSDPSMRLYKELMSRRAGPVIERFPWIRVRTTLRCGLGLFSTCPIPAHSIICPYTARIVTEEEFAAYRAQVHADRPETAEELFQTVNDYQVELSLRNKRYYLEGFRLTHRGVITLGRYANSSSCPAHLNARLRHQLVPLPTGGSQFLAVLVATRAIAEDEPILWLYDQALPDQFACPACVGEDGRAACEPTDEKIRLKPTFGPDALPERTTHCMDSSMYDPAAAVPYSDAHTRPLIPSEILLAMANRMPRMGERLENLGELSIGSISIEKLLTRGKRLLTKGDCKVKEGETRLDHQSLIDVAILDPSNRHLLFVLFKDRLIRSLAICPPSSSSFAFGAIIVSRVAKKDATNGIISVLGPKGSPTEEDRSLISSLLESKKPVKVVDETSNGVKELFRYD